MAQAITIIYAGLTIGGALPHRKIRKYTQRRGKDVLNVSCEFLVADSDIDTFAALTATADVEGSKRDQTIKITIGTVDVLDVKESDFSAFNVEAVISKTGDIADTARTRVYTLDITANLDPSKTGFGGRFDTEIQTVYLENRARRVLFNIKYHAQGAPVSENALERYLGQAKIFAQSFLDNLDSPSKKWQLKAEDIRQNEGIDEDPETQEPTVVTATLQYDLLVASQGATPDTLDPEITSQNISLSRSQAAIEDTVMNGIRAKKFEDFTITYSVVFNVELTTDLRTKYDTKARALAIKKAQQRYPELGGILSVEDVTFDDVANSVTVQMRFSSASTGQFVKIGYEQTMITDEGLIITPLLLGDVLLADVQQGPKIIGIRQSLTQTYVFPGSRIELPDPPDGYLRLRSPEESVRVFEIGRLGRRLTLVELRQTVELRRLNQYKSGGKVGQVQSVAGSTSIEFFGELVALGEAGGTAKQGANPPKVK